MKHKKIIIVVVLIFLHIINNRNGVNIRCDVDYPVSEGIVQYRQDDSEWKNQQIGESKYTMKSSGCIITCIATAISESAYPLNPEEVADLLSDKNVFDKNGNLQWGQLDGIEGFNCEAFATPNVSDIDKCLAAGHYPIVKVHRNTLFSYHHYILIVGAVDGEYICMDPLEDNLTSLSNYGNRIYAVRSVWYE